MFITIEGGEGAGKSTLIQGLQRCILSKGLDVIVTREPGGTDFGERIRDWLLHSTADISPMAELQLFLAVRAQHLHEVILPALKEGKFVLCDRYNDSSIAYQGYGRGLGVETVSALCQLACEGKNPDLTFYLDLAPVEGLSRLGKQRDRIESEQLSFHHCVREGFLAQAEREPDRMRVLNAREPKEVVLALAIGELDQRLQARV
jgi:dTMP kinase